MDLNKNKRASLAPPTIADVVDSKGIHVPSGSTTSDTALTLSGSGDVNAVVLILDLGQIIGSASVKIDGTWVIAVTAPLGEHRYTVKLSNGPESPEWIIHVATAVIKPVIIRVEDSQGNELPEGEATFDRNVTVTGTAQEGERVEINDGPDSWGTALAADGTWTKALNGLAVRGHSLTAKGLYGNEPVSDPWGFTVTAATVPVITRVQDADGDVANGGSTEHQTVTLTGTAARNQRVEILDNDVSKGVADVGDVGAWTLPLTGLSFGTHSVSAKALYGDGPESGVWGFTVDEAVPPLTIDTSRISLSGIFVSVEQFQQTGQDVVGTVAQRQAMGGSPPYVYTESGAAVSINPSTGRIKSRRNGNGVVTVTDQKSQSVSYPITVTNVYGLAYSAELVTHEKAVELCARFGMLPMSPAAFASLALTYVQPFSGLPHISRWCCTVASCPIGGSLYHVERRELICEYTDRQNGWWALNPSLATGGHTVTQGETSGVICLDPMMQLPSVAVSQAQINNGGDYNLQGSIASSAITRAEDSAGIFIPNNGTTTDTALTLSGTGTASVVVVIYDSGRPIGSASVTSQGVWQISIEAPLGVHSFTVRSTGESDSPPWVITVTTAAQRPVITTVLDSQGLPIFEGGDTFDTRVTLSGTAQAGTNIEIDDGDDSWGTAPAPGGNWTKTLSGLAVKAYSMTAKDTSGSTQPVSDPWRFNVVLATAPTITRVEDAAGDDIAPDTTSFTSSVTLTGTATVGEQVQIFDATTPLGTVTAAGGVWTLALPSLQYKTYSIKAVGQYGSHPESPVRRFTIAVATAPVITSVRDSHNVEIPDSGTTTDTQVTIMGTAQANEQVQILDGSNPLTTLTATGGNWTYTLSTTVKAYSIKARGLYGDNPESGVWGFTVQQATPPLVVDTTPVTLSANTYILAGGLPVFPPGSTVSRPASGGVPPYSYNAANPQVAAVDGAGLVSVRANGVTTVTVSDSKGGSLTFTVTVQNVFAVSAIGSFIWNGAVGYQPPGGHLPSRNELRWVYAQHLHNWPLDRGFWWSSEFYGNDLLGKRYWGFRISDAADVQDLEHFSHGALSIKPT